MCTGQVSGGGDGHSPQLCTASPTGQRGLWGSSHPAPADSRLMVAMAGPGLLSFWFGSLSPAPAPWGPLDGTRAGSKGGGRHPIGWGGTDGFSWSSVGKRDASQPWPCLGDRGGRGGLPRCVSRCPFLIHLVHSEWPRGPRPVLPRDEAPRRAGCFSSCEAGAHRTTWVGPVVQADARGRAEDVADAARSVSTVRRGRLSALLSPDVLGLGAVRASCDGLPPRAL